MKRLLAAAVLASGVLIAATASCQRRDPTPSTAARSTETPAAANSVSQISFRFDRPGLAVPRFTLTISEDDSGRYEADETFPAQRGSSVPPESQHIDRAITLSKTTTRSIFATARQLNRFNITCASNAKNIADTGTKTLHYTGEGGDGTCVYNYSEIKQVVALTDLFQAIALTLDLGRKLDFGHRFDRLGLDGTMATLTEQVEAGRAAELGTIATTLRSIEQDSDLLQRVRLRAAKLLGQVEPSV